MLDKRIGDRIYGISGSIGIYYKDLRSGYTFVSGNTDRFVAAGVAKLFLLIEVFRQIEEGIINGKDIYILKKEDKAPSIGAIMNLHEGIELTIEDLYKLMISVGDNSAFNILAKLVGIKSINNTLSQIGFSVSRVNRLFFDKDGISKGIENWVSVTELGEIYELIYNQQLLSKSLSLKLIDTLVTQQRNYVIPYHFNEYISIAHQIGEDDGIIHDGGIVFTKNPFVLCMCSNNADVRKSESAMRDIALICMKYSNKVN